MDHLVEAHGGGLVPLVVDEARRTELRAASRDCASWDLAPRQLCDLELLLNGGFSSLRGFMGRSDYESVRDGMRLASGGLWPIPVVLDVTKAFALGLKPGQPLALRKEFTGVSAPYESPEDAGVVIDTQQLDPGEAAQEILLCLDRLGSIGPVR